MTLIEYTKLIVEKVKYSLSAWSKGKRIDDFLGSIFGEYNRMLFDINTSINILSSKHLEAIELAEQSILRSLQDYLDGHLCGALSEIKILLQDINSIDGLNIIVLKSNEIWYRGRVKENNVRLYKKQEMFHIPNHMREKVNNQRFSLNGYPCLYLGKSIWSCWEELNEPNLDDVCFSALKLMEDVKALDLSIPTNDMLEKKTSDELLRFFVTLPLIISCSIKTLDENANFKSEYVIPQLLMANLINSSYFEGFVFTSTKQNSELIWNDGYLLNVVLPTRGDFGEDGLCISLKEKIRITDSICYKYEFLKSTISNAIVGIEQEVENVLYDKERENEEDWYPRSLFGQLENVIKTKDFSAIS